jgi:anthranilate synthase/aminodeoxychorismate synthase-like glutamine amidotransferase
VTAPRVLIIDNYDSFVHNLYQRLGFITNTTPWVVRNDRMESHDVDAFAPSHIVLSPGPGNPRNRGVMGDSMQLLDTWAGRVPVLGVCLGHQAIGIAYGADVVRAPAVMHGKTSQIVHDASGIFSGLPSPLRVMRYHSLVLSPRSMPARLQVTARTEDGIVMAVRDRHAPTIGLQFHPESIGTELGDTVLENFVSSSVTVS